MTSSNTSSTDPQLALGTRAGRLVLVVTVLGSGIAQLDSTVVSIGLPVIGRAFKVGVAELQWVVNGYLLTLAGLLLLGGVLGDRYGRRRIFLVGVSWFALSSVLCGLAPDAGVLIAARVLEGIGGALLTPGSLAILQASFAEHERGKAIGAWSGLSGVAAALGPFVGGYLISAVSWRLIFFINLPLAAIIVVAAPRVVPETRDPAAPHRVDVAGGVLATAGLVGVTYGLIEGGVKGWASAPVIGALMVGIACLVAFVLTEKRRADPLLPVELFASRQFIAANIVTFLVYGALGGAFFLLPVQLEQVARYSPLEAGASLLPVTALMLMLSRYFGALAARIGPKLLMGFGPLIAGAGLALLVRVGPTGTYLVDVLPAIAAFGFGLSITVAPLTATVLAAAPGSHSGAASAINNDVARTASLVTVAVLPAAAGITGLSYLHPALFNGGFHTAAGICAMLCGGGGLLAFLTVSNKGGSRAAASTVGTVSSPVRGRSGASDRAARPTRK